MSYTRPPASAADATWQGAAAYARPASTAADVSFVVGYTASGFTSTVFAVPLSVVNQSGTASGFASMQFGMPYGNIIQTGVVTGISDTQFGTPSGASLFSAVGFGLAQFGTPAVTLQATGFDSTLFGIFISRNYFPAQTLGAITRFGALTSPSPLTVQATGTTSSRLGLPFAFKYAPINLAVLGQVFGIAPGKIGTPDAGQMQTGYASSVPLSAFGSPVSVCVQQPAGFSSILFGTSSVSLTRRASGFNTTSAGNPVLRLLLQATGVPFGAFGEPVSVRSQQLAGFSSTLFGTYTLKLTQQVSGFNTTGVGTPVSALLLQATSTAPKLRFGQPDVLRSNTFSTYGINASDRFGRPSGFCRFNRFAASFVSGALGTPTCFQRHRVATASPETRFGQPLLRRAATC